jgi:hypothetical protein
MPTESPPRRRVVVDGSNIATEGRTLPSLAQLDEAIRAFLDEFPGFTTADVTVVVDASFSHRIDPSEVPAFEEAVLHGEMVTPPAGAVGRGDGFILRIAEKSGALVLSNDSFQEFHAERPWLFDDGRLIGGKPVPGVGWVFTPRTPVRGPKSRAVTSRSRRDARAEAAEAEPLDEAVVEPGAEVDGGRSGRSAKAAAPGKAAKAEKARKSDKASKTEKSGKAAKASKAAKSEKAEKASKAEKAAKAEKASKSEKSGKAAKATTSSGKSASTKEAAPTRAARSTKATKAAKPTEEARPTRTTRASTFDEDAPADARGPRRGGRSTKASAPATTTAAAPATSGGGRGDGGSGREVPALNEPLAFLSFVAEHPVGSTFEGTVASFTSHGAHVDVGSMRCHVPLRGLADPPAIKARDVLTKGETREFVLVSLDAGRRRAELALPGIAS